MKLYSEDRRLKRAAGQTRGERKKRKWNGGRTTRTFIHHSSTTCRAATPPPNHTFGNTAPAHPPLHLPFAQGGSKSVSNHPPWQPPVIRHANLASSISFVASPLTAGGTSGLRLLRLISRQTLQACRGRAGGARKRVSGDWVSCSGIWMGVSWRGVCRCVDCLVRRQTGKMDRLDT